MDAKKAELRNSDEITVDLVFETAPLLMKSGKYEETSFALILITIVKDNLIKSDFIRLESWFETGIANWAHADYFGMFFLPELMEQVLVDKQNDFTGGLPPPINSFSLDAVPVTFIKLT